MTQMTFTKAIRKSSKLRLAVGGPSGSGKTTASLRIAKGLGGRTALIDTERGSASLYSDEFEFDVLELGPPYTPERFIEAIDAAEAAGYDNLIIDSATHVWDGAGGCLEANEKLAVAKYKGNTWSAWSETTPRYRALIDRMLQSKMHVIITMRSKTETVQTQDKKVAKVGTKLEMRSGIEYEFTVVFELEHESHMAVQSKDRTKLFPQPQEITAQTGARLLEWLNSGVDERMSPEELRRWVNELTDAATLDDLKASFSAAHAAAKRIDDKAALKAITEAKDARKASLSKPDPRGDGEADPAEADRHFAAIVDILNDDLDEVAMGVKLSEYAQDHLRDEAVYIAVLDKLAGGKHCPKEGWRKFMNLAKQAKEAA